MTDENENHDKRMLSVEDANNLIVTTVAGLISGLDNLADSIRQEHPEIDENDLQTIDRAAAIARDKIKEHPAYARLIQ